MRIEIRALAIRRRSIVAIRRPNNVVAGDRRKEAVSDMFVPLIIGRSGSLRLRTKYVYQIPETTVLFAWQHMDVCSAPKMA